MIMKTKVGAGIALAALLGCSTVFASIALAALPEFKSSQDACVGLAQGGVAIAEARDSGLLIEVAVQHYDSWKDAPVFVKDANFWIIQQIYGPLKDVRAADVPARLVGLCSATPEATFKRAAH